MSDASQEEVVSIVNSLFEVEQFTKTLYSLEFKILDSDFKSKFVELSRKLENLSYAGKLESMEDGRYIIIQKFAIKKRKILDSSWTPRILFAVVISFVMIDGYYRTDLANSIVEIGDPYEMAGIYTLALLGILGVHESGHIIASRIHKLKTTWPYFMPGIPIFGIPTFGAFIQARSPTINRELLFDVAIAGPIAGLVIAIIVSMYGAYTAPILDESLAQGLFEESRLVEWELGEPILMTASLELFGKGGDSEVLMTPLLFAAWIGFLITFLNLLPAWQLDGGHLARTLMGAKLHKYATYGSMAILVLLDFWLMAIFILLLSSRSPGANPLDDISPISPKRKLAYVGVIVLAILCAPIPSGWLPW
ncbi:MAG: site-2 protease family protein [Nitrosopumilaceae archaeon]|nr:site-2 protease family protein [Nitrosopumilaceae archaeon]